VEELTIERATFDSGGIQLQVVNGGPEPVTIAQVTVDEALWNFEVESGARIERLGRATVDIPYPWVDGEPLAIALISSTGLIFTHEVEVATLSPTVGRTFFVTFTLLGVYVGVIPVLIGLVWFPFLRTLSARWLNFFLSLTIGILLFLGVDSVDEAIKNASGVAGAFQGIALAAIGFIVTFLGISVVDRWRDRVGVRDDVSALMLAYAISVGIGLHNLGEGLAIGAAYTTGAVALGTFLVIGFTVQNTTEGLAIVAPLSKGKTSVRKLLPHLLAMGALAGIPTIFGAWVGGFAFSPVWSTLFMAVGAGAIFQVAWQIARLMGRERHGSLADGLNAAGLTVGLLIMYGTGLLLVS
jgi:zinc transporter ZupT